MWTEEERKKHLCRTCKNNKTCDNEHRKETDSSSLIIACSNYKTE